MTTPVPEKKRNGCLIAVVIVFVLILAALLLSGKQVRKLWDLGKEVFALQAEIETAFELQDVGVHWRVSGDLSTLDVEVDAQALGDKTDADREALAEAIAKFVHGRLESLQPDRITVTYVWKSGILKNSEDYRFDPADLNPE